MGRPFYCAEDPFCRERQPDDKAWGLDHFYRKLLTIQGTMNTEAGKRRAADRSAFLRVYLDQLERELE